MTLITLSDIKAQLRIESDFTAEDTLLTSYGNSAEQTIAQYLNRGDTVAEMTASLTEQYGSVPENIKHAALMLVDTWYQYRSPISGQSLSIVPYTFDILVKPYMIL